MTRLVVVVERGASAAKDECGECRHEYFDLEFFCCELWGREAPKQEGKRLGVCVSAEILAKGIE